MMWKSIGGKGGMGMSGGGGGVGGGGIGGSGGGGGGGVFKTFYRGARGGVGDRYSRSSSTSNGEHNENDEPVPPNHSLSSSVLSLSSAFNSLKFSPPEHPNSSDLATPTLSCCSSPTGSEESGWHLVFGSESQTRNSYGRWSLPCKDEVENAVSALQQVLPIEPELDWIEPSPLQPYGSDRVYDAFHLLQTDPCVQRMVISLSSDKAVWDAVLNNEVVREIRESFSEGDHSVPENLDNSADSSNGARNILSWIFDNTKVKVMVLIEKVMKLVNDLLPAREVEKATGDTDPFESKLRTSFLLSILVLLIVFVGRDRGP